MLKTSRKKLFTISLALFLLLPWAGPEALEAFSVVFLKNGSIYIGHVLNPGSEKISDLALKTELGIVKIAPAKIEKIINDEKNLEPLHFKDSASENLQSARLLKKNPEKSVILANGKILEINNEKLFFNSGPGTDQLVPELPSRERPPKSNRFHAGISFAGTSFPFAKVDKSQNNRTTVTPYADRYLWGAKAPLGYTPLPWLQLALVPEYFTLYNPRKNDSFMLFSPIRSYSEKLDSRGISLDLFLKIFDSWLGIGSAYRQVTGKIEFSFINTQLNIPDSREIKTDTGYWSLYMTWKHDYYIHKSLSLSPAVRISRDFISGIFLKTDDPLLMNEFKGFYQNKNYGIYRLEFSLALLFHF